ncbi:DUF6301 family protein [Nocardia neocaledoniensis]|uniref:DUF6301 family protein n=1 Tax=Nocardia neocaledoniensis TaxID=236511 RepID=UPI002457A957|nr:DUF6301 family protein [Nocardia neocaledoniensis]
MTDFRTRTPDEVAELGGRLRALDWSWQLAEIPEIAEQFGWRVVTTSEDDDWAMLDTGMGLASGKVFADDGDVEKIQVSVSTIGPDTTETHTLVQQAYTAMAERLAATLGAPSAQTADDNPQSRWAGSASTLILAALTRTITLTLASNEWLELFDEGVELSRQGQL